MMLGLYGTRLHARIARGLRGESGLRLSCDHVRKSSAAGLVDDGHFEFIFGDPNEAKVVVIGVVKQPGRIQPFLRCHEDPWTSRQRSNDIFMEIGDPIPIGIIGTDLD